MYNFHSSCLQRKQERVVVLVFQLLLSMFQIPRFCAPVDEMSKGFNKIEGVDRFEKSI